MCPVCIGTMAFVIAKGATASGLAAVAVTKVRAKNNLEMIEVLKATSQYQNEKENSL